jgi:hypothetical protein
MTTPTPLRSWDKLFSETQDALERMAEHVRNEIRAGRAMGMKFGQDGHIEPEPAPPNSHIATQHAHQTP